ncbi:MAG: hypothetical protein GEU83_01300 [Pseudonocardiaceae bacterium]|nr:hypothetical protein [Pseudonocardiaceae bacterium]
MPVTKVSVSLDSQVVAAARAAAQAEGVSLSTWLSRAAEHVAGLEAMRQAVEEFEVERGAISEDQRRAAREILDAPWPVETSEQRARRDELFAELYDTRTDAERSTGAA